VTQPEYPQDSFCFWTKSIIAAEILETATRIVELDP
jgi:hypothetical protein